MKSGTPGGWGTSGTQEGRINTDKKEMILERSIYLNYNKSGAKTDR